MNLELIGILVRLRYRLLWANTRTRNGKIALFMSGYLLLVVFGALMAAGGMGAGVQAIQTGRGALVAGLILTAVFVQAMLASVMLGFGMAVIFSDAELRRYPLRAHERRLTRHLIGIVDPFWIIFFLLDVGIATGLFLYGNGGFWYGFVAMLLLFVCNYLAARVLAMVVQKLTSQKFGSVLLLAAVVCFGLLPAMLEPVFRRHPAMVEAAVAAWRMTPTAAAGVAMTRVGVAALQSVGVIFLWMAAIGALLILMERWPQKVRIAQSGPIGFVDRMDRVGSVFGPKTGPLVAHWLRFYSRHTRFRAIYPLALPLAGFLMFFFSRQPSSAGPLPVAISVFGILGFIGTGQFAVNQFGYVGGGFRRFLLLPTDPAAAFRAGSYMFVSLSGALIPLGLVLWSLFGPMPLSAALLVMLLGCSVTVLFLFHGVALWTSLFGARRGRFNMTFGNDLSFAGNVAVIGTMMLLLFGPRALAKLRPGSVSTDYWWVTPLLAVVAIAFYVVSLRLTSKLFRTKREDLMALMEGKG